MRVQVVLTGPPRVVLGRAAVELGLPLDTCTLDQLLDALARAEPRIASYLRAGDGLLPPSLRPLLNDHLLEPAARIPDGSVVTLLYAVAGGRGGVLPAPPRGRRRWPGATVSRESDDTEHGAKMALGVAAWLFIVGSDPWRGVCRYARRITPPRLGQRPRAVLRPRDPALRAPGASLVYL